MSVSFVMHRLGDCNPYDTADIEDKLQVLRAVLVANPEVAVSALHAGVVLAYAANPDVDAGLRAALAAELPRHQTGVATD